MTATPTATACDCGHTATAEGIGTGYATMPDGRTLCYPCADDSERATMHARGAAGEPMTAYLSGDALTVTTWSGGHLAAVQAHTVSRSGWHNSEVHYVRAVQTGGRVWSGRNAGPGMVITLRPLKGDR